MITVPPGVRVMRLTGHRDHRGELREVFRPEWLDDLVMSQWTLVYSGANVVRGLHCHRVRTDAVTVVQGSLRIVLADVRPEADDPRVSVMEISATDPHLVIIPPGVGHAFETIDDATILCGLDTGWSTSDELGCSWADPIIADAFFLRSPLLSERDRTAGSFADLRAAYAAAVTAAPTTT